MALNRLLSICFHPHDSFDDLEVDLLTFHKQYNQSSAHTLVCTWCTVWMCLVAKRSQESA